MSASQSCVPGPAATGQLPLIALLGQAHDALEADFNVRIKATEYGDLSLAHSRNVLRHLGPETTRVSALTQRCGVSKQALSLQAAHLEKAGYITSCADPHDGRARRLALTERGIAAQRTIHRLLHEIDEDWRQRWGPDEAVVRRLLGDLLGR